MTVRHKQEYSYRNNTSNETIHIFIYDVSVQGMETEREVLGSGMGWTAGKQVQRVYPRVC
jgi:hypothetical protein